MVDYVKLLGIKPQNLTFWHKFISVSSARLTCSIRELQRAVGCEVRLEPKDWGSGFVQDLAQPAGNVLAVPADG
jgi:hypothetical protein